LKAGDTLNLLDIFLNQQFTQPPYRYNEATLIKALEQKGIGRPSTYAPILSTIQDRGYIYKESGKFRPDEIGIIVNDLLADNFPGIVDLSFTAQMEDSLDEIARGKKEWVSVLKGFYSPFEEKLQQASENLKRINTDKATDEVCINCGKPMVIKSGRFGKFLACTGYPDCKTTKPLLIKIGISCPECGKGDRGELVERISKKKRRFYGCSRYPECKFTIRQKPVPQPCPKCSKLMVNYRRGQVKCTGCEYKGDLDES
jgi:DNA topoisomerase-1